MEFTERIFQARSRIQLEEGEKCKAILLPAAGRLCSKCHAVEEQVLPATASSCRRKGSKLPRHPLPEQPKACLREPWVTFPKKALCHGWSQGPSQETHLHLNVVMELLAGGCKGLRCPEFEVPQLVLHPGAQRRVSIPLGSGASPQPPPAQPAAGWAARAFLEPLQWGHEPLMET